MEQSKADVPPTKEQSAYEKLKKEEEDKVKVEADYSSGGESDNETEIIQLDVPKSYIKYKLKPKVIGDNKITFYDAEDVEFYNRVLPEPLLIVWLLSKDSKLLYTSKRFFESGWKNNIQVYIRETHKFDLVVSQEGLSRIYYDGKVVEKLPDCVIPRLGANVDYFSLAVVRQLEKAGVMMLNPISSLLVSKDKMETLQQLATASLPIPKTMIARFPIEENVTNQHFSYPLILKKSSGSQGKGVMLINSQEHLSDMGDMLDQSKPMIIQEFISKSSGKDLRVFVVGGKVIGGMMRIAKKGFKANFHQGGYVRPVKLSAAVEWLAIECARLVGLEIAGVDILIDHDSYKICEINSSPGFQGFELATGIDVPQQIMEFVKLRSGVWKKTSTLNQQKNVVLVPVSAEHVELGKSQSLPQDK
ncbi:alpha-L-glutamate ligase [Acrasis kona]|uniref:N-acetylaspartylglutamate synthase n=1 Tax=Acrasis kona TaxID=1008807 RepID=A0AAW2YZ16_9EUKA